MTVKDCLKVYKYVGEREYTNKQGVKSNKHYFYDYSTSKDTILMAKCLENFKGEIEKDYIITYDFIEYRKDNEWRSFKIITGIKPRTAKN